MIHVGLDMHKRYSRLEVMEDSGKVLDRRTLYHDNKEEMKEFFSSLPKPVTVAMEATRSWYWLYELLEEEGLMVKLAHPKKTKIIGEAKIKTDSIDAHILAQLERTDFLPEAYIPPIEIREQRELLRYRNLLVRIRTMAKNRVHDVIDKLGITHSFSDLFGKKGINFLKSLSLPYAYQKELTKCLEMIEFLNVKIKEVENDIDRILKEDERAELLMTIPGIGKFTAYLLLAEIGEIDRFHSARKLCCYAGIVSSTRDTGGKKHQGPITKEGNKHIRWAIIEITPIAIKKDPALNAFYQKLDRSKGKFCAKVATARKLLVAVYGVLSKGEPYKFNSLTKIHMGKPVVSYGH
jgi:transposase